MKQYLVVFTFLIFSFLASGQAKEPATRLIEDLDPVFTIVENPPQFIGGEKAFYKFMKKHSKFKVVKNEDEGFRAFAMFIVDKTGNIDGISFPKELPQNLEKEMRRLLSLMPAWQPGMQNGKPVKVEVFRKVSFQFN